jgi:hypothetical protein
MTSARGTASAASSADMHRHVPANGTCPTSMRLSLPVINPPLWSTAGLPSHQDAMGRRAVGTMSWAACGAVVRYVRLPADERALTNEALVELLRATWWVRVRGWSHYARSLGEPTPGPPTWDWDGDLAVPRAVARAVGRWCRLAPEAATCLIRALAGQRMLGRRGVPTALVLGLRTGGPTGDLSAHGWLNVGRHTILGAEGKAGHRAVAHFSARTADSPGPVGVDPARKRPSRSSRG